MTSLKLLLTLAFWISLTIPSVHSTPYCPLDPYYSSCPEVQGGSCSSAPGLCPVDWDVGELYGYLPCSGTGCMLQNRDAYMFPRCSVLDGPFNTSCTAPSSSDYCNFTLPDFDAYMPFTWVIAPCVYSGCCYFQYSDYLESPSLTSDTLPNPCMPNPGATNLSSLDYAFSGLFEPDQNESDNPCWLMYPPQDNTYPRCIIGCDSMNNVISNTSFVFWQTNWAACNFSLINGNWINISPGSSYTWYGDIANLNGASQVSGTRVYTCDRPGWLTFVQVLGWILFVVLVVSCCGCCGYCYRSKNNNSTFGAGARVFTYNEPLRPQFSNNGGDDDSSERRERVEWAFSQRLQAIEEETRAQQRRYEENRRREEENYRQYQIQQRLQAEQRERERMEALSKANNRGW